MLIARQPANTILWANIGSVLVDQHQTNIFARIYFSGLGLIIIIITCQRNNGNQAIWFSHSIQFL